MENGFRRVRPTSAAAAEKAEKRRVLKIGSLSDRMTFYEKEDTCRSGYAPYAATSMIPAKVTRRMASPLGLRSRVFPRIGYARSAVRARTTSKRQRLERSPPSEAQKVRASARTSDFREASLIRTWQAARHSPPDDSNGSVTRPHEGRTCFDSGLLLSCHRSETARTCPHADDPHGLIAPFARRNYYKTAARLMGRLVARHGRRAAHPEKAVRIFSNSRLPEKPLCVAAGLAWQGNNGLCIARTGVPLRYCGCGHPGVPCGICRPDTRPTDCGSCRRCIEACPTRAIRSPGIVDRGQCLQGLAASADALPPTSWKNGALDCTAARSASQCAPTTAARWRKPPRRTERSAPACPFDGFSPRTHRACNGFFTARPWAFPGFRRRRFFEMRLLRRATAVTAD